MAVTPCYVLNIGSGSIDIDRFQSEDFIVHVDSGYPLDIGVPMSIVKERIDDYMNDEPESNFPFGVLCDCDIFYFVENFPYKIFNKVIAERIFEHIDYSSGGIGRLLEGLNRVTASGATLSIVVPNAIHLAHMLLDYEIDSENYDNKDSLNQKLILNTEFTNTRSDPHCSIWTPTLAREYIESEGTWEIIELIPSINFAGRDCYMKIECKKTS